MKSSEALLIAREQTRREALAAGKEIAIQLLKSPAIQMLVCVALVELGQMVRPDGEHQIISDITGSAIEGVVISASGISALSTAVGSFMPKVTVGQ